MSGDLIWRRLMDVGAAGRRALDGGAPRAQVLQSAGELLLRAFGSEDAAYALAAMGPSMALAWCESGFSSISVEPRLAASLMSTSIPTAYCDQFRLPWRSFKIDIPLGVIGPEASSILVVHAHSGQFYTITVNGSRLGLGTEPNLKGFLDATFDNVQLGAFSETDANEHHRADLLMHKLVVGVALELVSRPTVRVPAGWKAYKTKKRGTVPNAWKFELRRPVRIDCRQAVAEYVTSGSRSPLVQSLVRGHHKLQPYGPKMALRKWIHVEPYWRGPEDGPIALRALSVA